MRAAAWSEHGVWSKKARFGIGLAMVLAAGWWLGCASSSGGASGSGATAKHDPTAAFKLEPCVVKGISTPVRCGVYEVFEHREERAGRKIGLKVVVVLATGEDREPDPVVLFAGGPGDSVTGNAAGIVAGEALLEHRDFVLVDVRGTGESNPLLCDYQTDGSRPLGLLEEFLPLKGVESCRAQLAADNDLGTYTTPVLVDDVHEVVTALGYTQVNLIGGSYGTRASLVYMRRHPQGVRTAVLEGVVPTYTAMPLYFARDAQTALDGLFAECAAEPSCVAAFPDLKGDLRKVLVRIEKGPVPITISDPQTDEELEYSLTWPILVQTLRYMLYSSASAQEVPLAVHLAAGGDYSVVARNAASYGGALGALTDGLYLSVTCPEDVALISGAKIAEEVEGTFLGDYRIRQQREACELWPKGPLPEGYWQPVYSEVPTLVVTGERDPVTPPRDAHRAARTLPNSRTMIIPDGGHGYGSLEGLDCLREIENGLIEQGSFAGLDLEGCIASIRRPPFPTEPPAEAIELSAAQLADYPGTYTSASPALEVTIRRVEGALLADTPFRANLRITPTSATAFRIEGAPLGYGFEFELDGGRVLALNLLQPGQEPTRLERVEE